MADRHFVIFCLCLGLVASATVEKREGSPMYGGYGDPYATAMAPYGGPMMSGGAPAPAGMGPMGAMGAMGAPPGGPYPPPYGMQGFPDPGFSIQTGFEGYLVPNSWYGLMPWGAEGVVVVVTGVIVFIVIAVVILGLLAWLCGFGDYAIVKEAARSFMPSNFSVDFDTLADITTAVFDALEKYNELSEGKNKLD